MERFTIKNWQTGEIIHEGESESFKEFVKIKKGNLSNAYLRGAYLEGANLKGADLKGADLRGANLKDAYLRGAYLSGAYLRGAYLSGAYLEVADLRGAYLSGANLKGANLRGAYLEGAYLEGADLEGANLENANLISANVKNSIIPIYSKRIFSIQLPNPNIEKQDVGKIKILIGCKVKTITEWDEWFLSDEEFETKRGTFEFKQIQAMYEAYKLYIKKLWS